MAHKPDKSLRFIRAEQEPQGWTERKLRAPGSGIASSSASAGAGCCRTLSPSSQQDLLLPDKGMQFQ